MSINFPVARKVAIAGTELNHATLSVGAKKGSEMEELLNHESLNFT
jgi:hypothetical protein